METETYKNAKLILERFDPDSKKKIVSSLATKTDFWDTRKREYFKIVTVFIFFVLSFKELEATPVGPPMTPRQGQGQKKIYEKNARFHSIFSVFT